MSLEFSFKNATRLALAASLLTEGVVNYIKSPETAIAIKTLVALNPSCTEILPSLHHYDLIAVFGAGTYVDQNGIVQPNSFQVERLKTAAAAVVAGYSEDILLIDGGNGSAQETSIELLEKYVTEISYGKKTLNPNKVKSITNSLNSAENVRDLAQYMKVNGLTNVLSVSDLFHYNRLNLLENNYGVMANFTPTECLAIKYFPEDTPYLAEREYSTDMLALELKEKVAILELSFDDKGVLIIGLKTLFNDLGINT